VASVLLFVAAILVTWGVLYRAMGNSTLWEIELAVYLMVGSLFLASPYTLATKGHVGVDLVSHYLPERAARRLGMVIAVVGLVVCAYLAYRGLHLSIEAFLRGERTESGWAPYKWPLYGAMPLGLGLTALQYIAELARPSTGVPAPQS
jgi:TRAP-type C4-dicarboxylate transport system permease small subunit